MAQKQSRFKDVEAVRRAALYIRVSTDEQAKKGYSLPAQKEDLEEYAKKHGYVIAGYYIDDGKSARKKFTNRKEFMRMMEDVEAGKIDVILFIKLDRWFRSVADYYKIQEILDRNGVAWKTTQEHYDTETTNGRLYINIRLSVAQDESDRDSDRIKFVFESKVARGEVLSGNPPRGYKIENKHLIPSDDAGLIRDIFDQYEQSGSQGVAMRYIQDTYGILLHDHTIKNILSNPIYAGRYRDNPNFCEAIIQPERFDRIQSLLKSRSVRVNQSGRIYIFSGLVRCARCNHSMTGVKVREEDLYYRCKRATQYRLCENNRTIREDFIESWLLENIVHELKVYETEWLSEHRRQKKPKVDRSAILKKLDKLKDLYINDFITMEQYKEDFNRYTAQLAAIEEPHPPAPDFRALEHYLTGDFKNIYAGLDRLQRRNLWRGIIETIYVDAGNSLRLKFR